MQSRYFSPGDAVRLTIDHLPLAAGRYGIDLTARVPDIADFDPWWTEIGFEIDSATRSRPARASTRAMV